MRVLEICIWYFCIFRWYRYRNLLRESTMLGSFVHIIGRKRRFVFRGDTRHSKGEEGGGVASWILALPREYVYSVRVWVERVKVGGTKRCFPQGQPGRSRLTLASKRLRVPIKVTLCLKFSLCLCFLNLFSFSRNVSFREISILDCNFGT